MVATAPSGRASHATGRCNGPTLTTHVKTVGCGDFAASPPFGGSKEDEITPEGCTNVAIYEIQDSKLSSFLQTEANRAAG
jgi:hypothetical protein